MHQTRRILVVDPCPDTSASTAWLLRWWGHRVQVARDGPAALEAARSYRPDVVLMEIALSGLDGCTVAQRLRQPDQLPQALLIAVTGYGGEGHRSRSRAAGFDYHLLKPVDPARLRTLLEGCPASSREAPAPDQSADGPARPGPPCRSPGTAVLC